MNALSFLPNPTVDRDHADPRNRGIALAKLTLDTMRQPLSRWWVLLALLASSGFLYLTIFVLPDVPRVAIGDQSTYLHNAARMYEGQMIYRDFAYFTLPGTDVLYMVLFRLFGIRAWIPQALLVLAGLISMWLSIKISSKIMRGAVVVLPGFLFLTLPFTSYLDATHHLFNVLAATAALAVVIEERTPVRLLCAGAFWGLGTCFAQSLVVGPAGFGLFLVWQHHRRKELWSALFKKEACLLASYFVTVAAFTAYFVWKAGLQQFLNYTVKFVAKYYSADPTATWRIYMMGWPSRHEWVNWPDLATFPFIHFLIPLVYILFFVWYWRQRQVQPEEPSERLMLVNVTGLCLFLTVASAPAWNRLYTISLPALILVVWFLNASFKLERALLRILWATVLVLTIVRPLVTQARWKGYLDLPTGRTAFFEPGPYQQTKWMLERTHPSDYFFGDQLLGFDLRLRNPSRVAFVRPNGFTRPEEVQDVVQSLEAHQVRFVGWYKGLDDPQDPTTDPLGPLRCYVRSHYRVAQIFSNGNEILERTN
jgi:hypothetical protein